MSSADLFLGQNSKSQPATFPSSEDDENGTRASNGKASSGSLAKDSTTTAMFNTFLSPHLCKHFRNVCKLLERVGSNRFEESGQHWETFLDLEKSANDGCMLCVQFVLGFGENVRIDRSLQFGSGGEAPMRISRYPGLDHFSIYLKFAVSSPIERKKEGPVFSDVTIIECDPPTSGNFSLKYSSNTIDSFAIASQWLTECMSSHSACTPPVALARPSRLLYLDKQQNETLLCCTDVFDQMPQYATLSHCWGTSTFLTLTTSKVDQFKTAIPHDALSKTFKDAIQITKSLGLSYIWIDSLCIVQDDQDDWKHESRLMASVYGSSTINIAAAAAHDGSEGCFMPRASLPCFINVNTNEWGTSRTFRCVSEGYDRGLRNLPLGKRGWCLQERVLPSRTLHFTHTEVFWESYKQLASEFHPLQRPSFMFDRRGSFSSLKSPLQLSQWGSITERYSQCSLTRSSDRFVAISGVAEIIQKQTGDEYLAGLWRENLEKQLCWRVRDTSNIPRFQKNVPPIKRMAPSWPWLSISGRIEPSYPPWYSDTPLAASETLPLTLLINIASVRFIRSSTDVFGQLLSGSLEVMFNHLHLVQNMMHDPEIETGSFSPHKGLCAVNLFSHHLHFDDPSSFRQYLRPLHPSNEAAIWRSTGASSGAMDSSGDDLFSRIYFLPVAEEEGGGRTQGAASSTYRS